MIRDGILHVNSATEKVSIYNMNGHKVCCCVNSSVIDISNLSYGIYVLIMHIDGKEYMNKFMK